MPGVSAIVVPSEAAMRTCSNCDGRGAQPHFAAWAMALVSVGPFRSKVRRFCTGSRSACSSSRSRFWTSAQYKTAVVTRTRANADAAYHAVSRAASDHGRSPTVVEDIAGPPHGVDQLRVERVVHLRPEPADVDVDDVRAAVEIHVPDLLGDERPRQHLADSPGEER